MTDIYSKQCFPRCDYIHFLQIFTLTGCNNYPLFLLFRPTDEPLNLSSKRLTLIIRNGIIVLYFWIVLHVIWIYFLGISVWALFKKGGPAPKEPMMKKDLIRRHQFVWIQNTQVIFSWTEMDWLFSAFYSCAQTWWLKLKRLMWSGLIRK